MEYRQLGRSGLKVPVLTLGTGTFGGTTEFFKGWGSTQEADQLERNLGAVGWELTQEQMRTLDEASAVPPIDPNRHQADFHERNPFPVR